MGPIDNKYIATYSITLNNPREGKASASWEVPQLLLQVLFIRRGVKRSLDLMRLQS